MKNKLFILFLPLSLVSCQKQLTFKQARDFISNNYIQTYPKYPISYRQSWDFSTSKGDDAEKLILAMLNAELKPDKEITSLIGFLSSNTDGKEPNPFINIELFDEMYKESDIEKFNYSFSLQNNELTITEKLDINEIEHKWFDDLNGIFVNRYDKKGNTIYSKISINQHSEKKYPGQIIDGYVIWEPVF